MNTDMIFFILFHAANLMAFLAFLLRDQLHLRLMMAASFAMQALYYYGLPVGPLWDPLSWKVVSLGANLWMIAAVFGDRFDHSIPPETRSLFHKISVLSPGQFRKLLQPSHRTSAGQLPLISEGQHPGKLHYLLRGSAVLEKGKYTGRLAAGTFLGEVAFLNGVPASATVMLQPGAECISWNTADLKDLMHKDKAIDIALRGVFNHDLAAKVAASAPAPLPT